MILYLSIFLKIYNQIDISDSKGHHADFIEYISSVLYIIWYNLNLAIYSTNKLFDSSNLSNSDKMTIM